jgi:hypothetical protein
MQMAGFTDEVWQRGLAQIRARAAHDPKFRQRCLEDAHAVIKEVCGLAPPADGPRVRFSDRMDEQVVLLPSANSSGALSEGELAKVVGGLASAQPGYGSICWSSHLLGT